MVDFVTVAILLSKEITPLLRIIIIVSIACLKEVWETDGKFIAIAQIEVKNICERSCRGKHKLERWFCRERNNLLLTVDKF